MRWWLVPVMWLWASSHGTWVAGVSVGVAVVLGLVLDLRPERRLALRWSAVVVLGAAATALTPLGLRLYDSFATVRAVSPYIQEWRTPTLSSPSVLATVLLALAVPVLWAGTRTRPGWTRLLLWAVALGWAALSMRTVAIGAVILAPLAAEALDTALRRPRPAVGRAERALVGGALAASLALAGILAAAGPRDPVGVPTATDAVLAALPRDTVVYDDDLLGGWLMWSHPDLRQTSDTRAELYGPEHARAYLRVTAAEPGWQADFDRHQPAAALVKESSPLAGALLARGWTAAARDAGYVLLEPSS